MGLILGQSTAPPPPPAAPPPAEFSFSSDTFHSIGMKWDIAGDDTGHVAAVTVEYKKAISNTWKNASNLLRCDYRWFYIGNYFPPEPFGAQATTDNFAGSILFLTPGTLYDVRIAYTGSGDPEDGNTYQFQTTTRAVPVKPTPTNTYYVDISHGGSDSGTSANPWQSLATANTNVVAGDLVLIRNGTYPDITLNNGGASEDWVVYTADSGHSPVLEGIRMAADWIWLDNLTFEWDGTGDRDAPGAWQDTSAIWITTDGIDDCVVTGCMMGIDTPVTTNQYSNGIMTFSEVDRWIIMDNTMIGHQVVGIGDTGTPGNSTGRGIALGGEGVTGGDGNVIAYNSITRFSDCIDNGGSNVDIYGNQLWDVEDDLISSDNSDENVRVWGNRMTMCTGNGISFQPQQNSPWYYLYNQIGDANNGVFKWRVPDRTVFINNTFVGVVHKTGHNFMRCYMRNNLFIRGSSPVWESNDDSDNNPSFVRAPQYDADWNTDIDHDGFDRGGAGTFFTWDDNVNSYTSILAWTTAVTSSGTAGISAEENGIEVVANDIFDDFASFGPTYSLILASGSNDAFESGVAVNNLSDFHGGTPDLGAFQRDATALPYGPRSGTELVDRAIVWDKH